MFGMMHWSGYGWDGGWLGWVGMVFWWVLVIFLVIAAIRWFSDRAGSGAPHGKSALDILRERYARGEIEKKEYEEKRKALES
jgi:putative membrane protein